MGIKIGFVKYKNEKEFRGTTLFSIKFEGDDALYRCGDEDSVDGIVVKGDWDSFKEGDAVKVQFDEDRKGNFNVEKLKVLDEGDDEYPEKPRRGGRGNGGKGRGGRGGSGGQSSGGGKQNVDWEAKDSRITLLACFNTAGANVARLLEHEAIALPAKTKKEDRREVIQGLIDVEAARLYRLAYDVDGFLASAGEHTDAPAKAPSDDDGFDDEASDSSNDEDDDF